MAMSVDQRPYDAMRYQAHTPQFTNPWAVQQQQQQQQHQQSLYAQPPQSTTPQQPLSRHGSLSIPYAANPAASTMGSNLVPSRSYESQYAAANKLDPAAAYAAAPVPSLGVAAVPRHSPEQVHQFSPYGYDADISRRSSYQHSDSSRSFSDVVDASRGMVAMSQAAYGPSRTGSQDSYGFPSNHSTHSSISSNSVAAAAAAGYPYYPSSYGSVDGSSVTDYSSASEDTLAQRTLPAPPQMINGFPPDQNTMMNQFNSKLAPNAQKKHKCKICDKRFTRPSSLQTHMYSHTGEKPFACDHEGCGRHFSVVSNLRRHKKVHKDDGDAGSPDDSLE